MNHGYRLVWSEVNRMFVPAPEFAPAHGKGHAKGLASGMTPAAFLLGAALALPLSAFAQAPLPPGALPTGGQVIAGQAAIGQSGSQMTVSQASDKAILHWTGFDIGSQASVAFQQPSASAVALNRVLAGDASRIEGRLSANGQVWLVNPNGVVFGQGARVDVGGLVTSTLDTTNEDFLAGRSVFHRNGATGRIENRGTLTAADGGTLALLAANVVNEGVISARLGHVVLAGGDRVAMDAGADGLLKVSVDPATVRSLIDNRQLIVADGGEVVMTNRAAAELGGGVVANSGTVQARTLAEKDGRILLLADMEHGETRHSGLLDASAPDGGRGGFIETSAATVKIADGARVTTLSADGGAGEWLIDPKNYTIAASGGDISGSTLSTNLGSSSVTILSSSGGSPGGSGDINVNDAVSWSSNTLTLTAARDININAVMTATGSASLEMKPATTNGGDSAVAGGAVKVGFAPGVAQGFAGRVDFSGTGSLKIGTDTYTIISTLSALQGINNATGKYALGANIDASATSSWNSGLGFAPLGSFGIFAGAFEGLGHTISNLFINRISIDYVGLFQWLGGATARISNVGMVGGSITGQEYTGGLVGAVGTPSFPGKVYNSFATGNVSGTNYVGGLAGSVVKASTFSDVYATGNVTGTGATGFTGGLFGRQIEASTLRNGYATGSVTGTTYVGGLAGHLLGTVYDSYATGDVSASGDYSGGLTGYLNGSGNEILRSYATGKVTSTSSFVGGLAGYNNSGAKIEDSYATGAVQGKTYVGGLVGDLSSSSISRSHASGTVTSTNTGTADNIGGLVGYNIKGTISESYATGNVTATGDVVGGLVGQSYGGIISKSFAANSVQGRTLVGGLVGRNQQISSIISQISNSYAVGTVTATAGSSLAGGLAAVNDGGSTITNSYAANTVTASSKGGLVAAGSGSGPITSSYWDKTIGPPTSAGSDPLLYAKTTAQMKDESTFSVWDFTSIWSIYYKSGHSAPNGDSYPLLKALGQSVVVTVNDDSRGYNGSTYSNGNGYASSGFDVAGTPVWGGSSQGAKNAGSYAIKITGGLSVDDSKFSTPLDYQLWGVSPITYKDGKLTINKANLTVSTGNVTKTYNGTLAAAGTATLTSGTLYGSDSLSGGSFAFTNKNVGIGNKTVTVSGVTVNDGNSGGNYNVTYANNTTSTINKANLTLSTSNVS